MTIYAPSPTVHTELKYLVKAPNSQMTELYAISKPREVFANTCPNCDERGNRNAQEDWVNLNVDHGSANYQRKIVEVGKFPKRCKPCNAKSVRFRRMGATLRKIQDVRDDLVKSSKFRKCKMITIGNKEALDKKEFSRRLKIFHRDCPWLIGGTFVKELGTKPMGDYNGMWHSHGVYIAPYMTHEQLAATAVEVEEYGLCLNKYKEARIDKNFVDGKLKYYITKYMCKDGGRKQSVGALYNCVREELQLINSQTILKIWKQPNRIYQTRMTEWIKNAR